MIICHPPYHDIIQFSESPSDLSNAASVGIFYKMFGDVVDNFVPMLKVGGHISIVIGDKYTNSKWVPLAFKILEETQNRGKQPNHRFELSLKSIVVKNMANNRAKANQMALWRWRALKGGFYVFKHEYILLFRRTK